MDRAFRDVIEFHLKASGPLSGYPPGEGVSDGAAKLRRRLNYEEFCELEQAILENDVAEIADACADLIYVAIGTSIAFGIDLPPIWDAVHGANMD
jgi:hypothetical protein